jgi:hypothetical protein
MFRPTLGTLRRRLRGEGAACVAILVVLMKQHEHWNQTSAVLLVIDKFSPAIVAHVHASHESAISPLNGVPGMMFQ